MIYLLHRLLNRSALKLWILVILSLSIVTDGRALYDQEQNESGIGKRASYEQKLANFQVAGGLYSRDFDRTYVANTNFRNPSAAFNFFSAVFTHSPALDPSKLFLLGLVLVGLAAWGRSHPPNTKPEQSDTANSIPVHYEP